ncbi:MAG: putative sulfate exporter family transporter [Deltaproteobacteria bacterium]|nr:putative sulfate exporter family transporter [Deltaproteobacteria bacterium]MBW2256152.1 putative sulfate exporter family transporter [Deltaproteobacteria bacterium]
MDQRLGWRELYLSEDWWAIWFSTVLLSLVVVGVVAKVPNIGKWSTNPLAAFPTDLLPPLGLLAVGLAGLTAIGVVVMQCDWKKYLAGFGVIFLLSSLSYFLAHQETMKAWGLGYAIWALGIGLTISNTVGTPSWLREGAKSEMFIKTGLVLLGAEILFSKILKLGAPGLLVAWVVTPTVIVAMWFFGTRWLDMASKRLVIIIAAATSVCGVSAAIATAAACRAKKAELTLAVGMTMIFTVAMMIGMPALSKALGLPEAVGGAWLGGTIDSTGAVVAAGAFLGEEAERVAAVVKMIQNVLIGVVAFLVAVFWVARVEQDADGPRPGLMEIWYRFPKFIVGFVLASLIFSLVLMPIMGPDEVGSVLDQSKVFRGWFFCIAFVSIGLESNFRELSSQLVGGKPIILYLVGQSFNIMLTLLMAYIAFGGVLFSLEP